MCSNISYLVQPSLWPGQAILLFRFPPKNNDQCVSWKPDGAMWIHRFCWYHKGRKKKLRSRMDMPYRSTNDGFVMQTKTSNTTLLKELKSKTQWHVLDVVGILGRLWNSLQNSCFSDPNSNKNLWNPWNYLMFCLFGRNSCPPSKEDSGQTGQSRIVPVSVCSQDWDLPPIAPIAWNYVRYQFLSSFVP